MKLKINGEVCEWDAATLKLSEGIALEEATGWPTKELLAKLEAGSMVAMRAVVWLLLRRNGKDIPIGDVDCDVYDLMSATEDTPAGKGKRTPSKPPRSGR